MEPGRDVTFRDAGLHSSVLRGANRAGAWLRSAGLTVPRLTPDAIRRAAVRAAGSDDWGEPTVDEPLGVLCDALESEARLSTFGRVAMRGLLLNALTNRLSLVDWAKHHPEVREGRIEGPWVVVGLPRTGTTLLSILLGLDPTSRALLQWEASQPVPPPDLASASEDPRIAKCAREIGQVLDLNPAIRAMHPMGATLATECVTLFTFDLRALLIETQAYVPSYGRWLERTDMASAYRMHRLALQVLQSRQPTGAWSLKTPNHLWCLDDLLAHYPDARILWTHRDPRSVVPSVASLNCALQAPFTEHSDPLALGSDWLRKLELGVGRGVAFDRMREERGDGDWCFHLPYHALLEDAIGAVERAYAHFGDEVSPLHRRRMAAWIRDHPQAVHGRHRYDARDFGLDPEDIAERFRDYTQHFDVGPDVRPEG